MSKTKTFVSEATYYQWDRNNCQRCAKCMQINNYKNRCMIQDSINRSYGKNQLVDVKTWKIAGQGDTECSEFVIAPSLVEKRDYSRYEVDSKLIESHVKTVNGKKRLVF